MLVQQVPLLNFLNYYYFGQQKLGITRSNPFEFNSWLKNYPGGFYASAETIGEFYGLCIILIIYSYTRKKLLNSVEILGLVAFFWNLLLK